MLDFFFPSPCLLCGKNGKPICTNCLLRLQLQLGRTKSHGLEIFYLSIYQDEIAKVITAIKDKGLTSLIIPLLQYCSWPDNWQAVTLVPIPSARQAEIKRGFSHTKLLAKALASKHPNLKVANLLRSKTRRLDQAGLSQKERLDNLAGAFECRTGSTSASRVVLIDDVYTTGATMAAARQTLESSGFEVFGCFVLALVKAPKSAI